LVAEEVTFQALVVEVVVDSLEVEEVVVLQYS
jgi:hypothetical protein